MLNKLDKYSTNCYLSLCNFIYTRIANNYLFDYVSDKLLKVLKLLISFNVLFLNSLNTLST